MQGPAVGAKSETLLFSPPCGEMPGRAEGVYRLQPVPSRSAARAVVPLIRHDHELADEVLRHEVRLCPVELR